MSHPFLKSEPTNAALSFINAYNASQGRYALKATAAEIEASPEPAKSTQSERLTHEISRSWSLQSGESERKTAVALQYGVPSYPERLKNICKAFADHAAGDDSELVSYVKKLNRELRRLESDLTVEFRPLDAHALRVEFFLVGPGMDSSITVLDRTSLIERRRAEDIADVLSQAPLGKTDQAVLESKLKASFFEGGVTSVESLIAATNVRLEKDCVDYRLGPIKLSGNDKMHAVSLTIDWQAPTMPAQILVWIWRI